MSFSISDLAEHLRGFVGDVDPSTPKGQKRLAIIETATRMFAEQGYRQTSMDELARALGVAKGTLYLYFPKKIDLLIAAVAREKLRWIPELCGLLESAELPATTRLKRWVEAVLLLPMRSPLINRLMSDPGMAAILAETPQDVMRKAQDLYPQFMQPLLDEVAGPGHRWSELELRDRANVLRAISAISPMLHHEAMRPGLSPDRFAALFADMIVDGIRPRPAPKSEQGASP